MAAKSDLLGEDDLSRIIEAVEIWRDHVQVEGGFHGILLQAIASSRNDDDVIKKLKVEREKYGAPASQRREEATLLLAKLITIKRNMLDRGGKAVTIEEIIG